MSRLPAVVFAMLAMASAGAFFFVQHLKSTTPLITGIRGPKPSAFNPRTGVVCQVAGSPVDFARMEISFYLLHRSDDVDVYMIDQAGEIVATLASGRHMVGGANPKRVTFGWNGREDTGRLAPDGVYYVRVDLIHQGRTYVVGPETDDPLSPVKVETRFPQPVVTSVTPQHIPGLGQTRVVIRYTGNEGHYGIVRIYRTDLPGRPRLVDSFSTPGAGTPAVWNGTIDGRPAPAGVYLVGLDVTDAACNTGHFPRHLPPAPGATRGAGLSVRYLTASAPLTPVAPGATATIAVQALGQPYTWALRAPGARKPVVSGQGMDPSLSLAVPRSPGVYELRLRAGANATTVPLVVSPAHRSPVMVVLPALTWQGLNPVDDTGDGLPNTLSAGRSVGLDRPLVNGLPAGLAGEEAVLEALRRAHHAVDVTTDVALIRGVGPSLADHHGVILAGSEHWITPTLARALRALVARGGTVLSIGDGTLRAYVHVQGDRAVNPGGLGATDVFGVRHGASTTGDVSVITDELGLFSGNAAGAFPGLRDYEPITGVDSDDELLSSAGVSSSSLGVVAVRQGGGNVVEVGLSDFAVRLAHDAQAQALLGGAWLLMTGA